LLVEILDDWLQSQNRRIEFARGRGMDKDARRLVRGIQRRTALVYRILRGWEGVLAVPEKESIPGPPDN
jgi:hypothetical protein